MNAKINITAILVAVALSTAATSAQGQMRGTSERFSTAVFGRYTRLAAPVSGWLDHGQNASFTVWLSAGDQYVIAGACDRDCSDVDLQLLSPTGEEIAGDFELDDEPVIYAVPTSSGRYEVRIVMAHCAQEPCKYFTGVFIAGDQLRLVHGDTGTGSLSHFDLRHRLTKVTVPRVPQVPASGASAYGSGVDSR